MSQNWLYEVQLVNDNNSFIHINKKNTINSNSIVLIKYGKDFEFKYYGSIHRGSNMEEGKVGINMSLVAMPSVETGSMVSIHEIAEPMDIAVLTITPKTKNDAVLWKKNYLRVTKYMLQQVKVVAVKQDIILKIDNFLIKFSVEEISPPMPYGLLVEGTKVELKSDGNNPSKLPKVKLESEVFRVVMRKKSTVTFSKNLCNDANNVWKVTSCPEFTKKFNGNEMTTGSESICLILWEFEKTGSESTVALSQAQMDALKVTIGSRVLVQQCPKGTAKLFDEDEFVNINPEMVCESYRHVRETIIDSWKCLRYRHCCNTLITGPPGSGKTFFLETLSKDAVNNDYYSTTLNCLDLKGKAAKAIGQIVLEKFALCASREPSILFLDNLDALISPDTAVAHLAYTSRLARIFTDFACNYQNFSRIILIATSLSVTSISSFFASVRGPRLFELVLEIPQLFANDRHHFLNSFGVNNISDDIIVRTKGFHVQDLVDLSRRAEFRCVVTNSASITEKHVLEALEDCVPRSLIGINVGDVPSYTWNDIGGMENVKNELLQVFEWPLKYPNVFNSCPLRLDTGALLYGVPGCGKTFIAGALAQKCGMHFISVKGPELLNKYIGKSEAGVRDVFDRAEKAKPCLIFFDELDSLAPKRGQDSSGVTDRVVNQMLTQLDGVESRAGVWVLGASTRPDLIDPALLRPGRLGKAIYCPLPSQEERLDVLNVLKKSLPVHKNVKFSKYAEMTEGYSCADLKGLLSTAHFLAEQDTGEDQKVLITKKHIDEATEKTQPSLSWDSLQQYLIRFEMFQNPKAFKKQREQFAKKVAYA